MLGTLSEKDFHIWVLIMKASLRAFISAVAVKGNSRSRLTSSAGVVVHDSASIIGEIPIVIKTNNANILFSNAIQSTTHTNDHVGHFRGSHLHGWVGINFVERFILDTQSPDGDSFCFVVVHKLDKVVDIVLKFRWIAAIKIASEKTEILFDPCRSGPRQRHDFEGRIDFQ